MTIPAAAAAAYRAAAQMATPAPATDCHRHPTPTAGRAAIFRDFLSGAIKDFHQHDDTRAKTAAPPAGRGQGQYRGCGATGERQAELTLDTVVAVRDKVVAAYQSIMQMPI